MTVYVDQLQGYAPEQIKRDARRYGRRWCHMTADADDELHAFAARLGLRRAWFQDAPRQCFRHYDLVPSKRELAVRLGAREVEAREHFSRRLAEEVAG